MYNSVSYWRISFATSSTGILAVKTNGATRVIIMLYAIVGAGAAVIIYLSIGLI